MGIPILTLKQNLTLVDSCGVSVFRNFTFIETQIKFFFIISYWDVAYKFIIIGV